MNLKFPILCLFAFAGLFSAAIAFPGESMEEEKSIFKRSFENKDVVIRLGEGSYTISSKELCDLKRMRLEHDAKKNVIILTCNKKEVKNFNTKEKKMCFSDLEKSDNHIKFENFNEMEHLEDLTINTPNFFIEGLNGTFPGLNSVFISCAGISSSSKNVKESQILVLTSNEEKDLTSALHIRMDEADFEMPTRYVEKMIEEIWRQFPNYSEIKTDSEMKCVPAIPLLCTMENKEKMYFSNLKKIDFAHNSLESISNLAFCDFRNLEELDLGYNAISSVQTLAKTHMPKLTTLDIIGNELLSIKALSRMNAPKLKNLGISSDSDNVIHDSQYLAKCTKAKVLKISEADPDDYSREEIAFMERKSRERLKRAGIKRPTENDNYMEYGSSIEDEDSMEEENDE